VNEIPRSRADFLRALRDRRQTRPQRQRGIFRLGAPIPARGASEGPIAWRDANPTVPLDTQLSRTQFTLESTHTVAPETPPRRKKRLVYIGLYCLILRVATEQIGTQSLTLNLWPRLGCACGWYHCDNRNDVSHRESDEKSRLDEASRRGIGDRGIPNGRGVLAEGGRRGSNGGVNEKSLATRAAFEKPCSLGLESAA
jgi:hypothetical protein